ncbi:ABC transporter permease [Microbacterium sp. RD1]|uniref:ABC transporter permease n=1 Tax=Microbacterium sp. RD1 TaxID=3457313 RepID=UPI003FA6124A
MTAATIAPTFAGPRRVLSSRGPRWAGWLALLAAAAVWQLAGALNQSGLFPPLTSVLAEVFEVLTSEALFTDVLPSVARTLAGFVVGSIAGIFLGVILGWWRWLEPWARPALEFCRAVPPPVLVPIAVAVYGSSDAMKIGIIALAAFWPVLLNTTDGIRRVEPGYIESARVYTTGGSAVILRRVLLPAATPQIATGLRVALALSLIVMVVSEMFGSSSGLGYLILQSQRLYAMTTMYAGILILGAIGILLTALFSVVERRALTWFEGMKGRTP